ncbi:SufB/SufD family protein [Haliovirga abyssi]|uniref:ABC transporter ATP-binding protein n=1 Tax=Haliovirga abyssi TaxID=2996794 RepID=A0AAU9DBE4_9FUSO|nr:SufD family Fe-S cluster assembly protein [Haliovirga abyssi]BDU50575.1 ABC transporter ATP-binding protein [Haliovirga abyssi]
MTNQDNMDKEFEALVNAVEKTGADKNIFKGTQNGFMLVDKNKVLGLNTVEGLEVNAEEIENGIKAKIRVLKGYKLEKPVHMCFGITGDIGEQIIESEYLLEEGSEAKFISHCSFPNAINVIHKMTSKIKIEKNAKMKYEEVHYHSETGGVEVIPYTEAVVEDGGYFRSDFKLVKGRVGKLDIYYNFSLKDRAIAEMDSKIYGKKDDIIKVKEIISLDGEESKGTVKARVFASDNTYSEVYTEIYGNAPYCKGHVDCVEVVKGKNAEVSAIPIIKVTNDLAELTHEASIGRVNKKELETLMARGLDEDEATDMIVKGMLK